MQSRKLVWLRSEHRSDIYIDLLDLNITKIVKVLVIEKTLHMYSKLRSFCSNSQIGKNLHKTNANRHEIYLLFNVSLISDKIFVTIINPIVYIKKKNLYKFVFKCSQRESLTEQMICKEIKYPYHRGRSRIYNIN